MKGLAWMAILSAVAIVAALAMGAVGLIVRDWFVVANGGVFGLAAIALSMLAMRE